MKKILSLLLLQIFAGSFILAQTPTNKLEATGNVGVGTTNPASKLEVVGEIKSSGNLYTNGAYVSTYANGNGYGINFNSNPGYYEGINFNLPSYSGDESFKLVYLSGRVYLFNNGHTDLMVSSATDKDILLGASTTVHLAKKANGNFLIGTNPTDNGLAKLQVYGGGFFSGNVGIGTSAIADANYRLFVDKGIRTRKVKVDQTSWPDYVFANTYHLLTLKEVEEYIKQHKHLPGIASAAQVEQDGLDLGENQAALLRKVEELTLYMIEMKKEMEVLKQKIGKCDCH